MSTATTGTGPIPMSRLVRVESRKLVDTRAGFWLLAAMLGVSAAATASVKAWGTSASMGYKGIFGVLNVPTGLLLPILAVLLITSEWSQRSGMVTFTVEPRRSRVVVAKMAVCLIAAALAFATTLAFATVGTMVVHGSKSGAWNMSGALLGYAAIGWAVALMQGFAFGLLFRNSAAGIVAIFILPTVWTLLATVIPGLHGHLQPWVDLTTAQTPFRSGDPVNASNWLHLTSSAGIWIGVPLVVGVWRAIRSDVK
jgi:ABC-2 type transport system permease protein